MSKCEWKKETDLIIWSNLFSHLIVTLNIDSIANSFLLVVILTDEYIHFFHECLTIIIHVLLKYANDFFVCLSISRVSKFLTHSYRAIYLRHTPAAYQTLVEGEKKD